MLGIKLNYVTLLQKYQYRQNQYSKIWESKCLALTAQMVRAFGMNPKVGVPVPLKSKYFLSQNFDTSTRISVRVPKMNAVARAQLAFQMLTLLQKYLYHQSQYSKSWDSKCLALIAQMVRAFGMNPKVGGSRPLRLSPPYVVEGVIILCYCKTVLCCTLELPFSKCGEWYLIRNHIGLRCI